MPIQIETYRPEFGAAMEALQRRYIAALPQGTKFVPRELYNHHPALEGGQNVFCAFVEGRVLAGYGALFPTPAEPGSPPEIPNTIWVHIRVDPEAERGAVLQDVLYAAILQRCGEYGRRWRDRRTRLAISYPVARQDEIAYFAAQGLVKFDALLQMARDLSEPLAPLSLPPGVTVRRWALETRQDRQRYLEVETVVFPQSPRTLDELAFTMRGWEGGTAVTAFDAQENIVGSVMAYWYGAHAITEDVFVVPGWRRKGLARYLIGEGMRYLAQNGKGAANLEVKESNQPAVGLYQSLGYRVVNTELQLGLEIS
jgi:ribosomal protein S18 acetylase RimI-like enzyme